MNLSYWLGVATGVVVVILLIVVAILGPFTEDPWPRDDGEGYP
jgi:hypothetical protein